MHTNKTIKTLKKLSKVELTRFKAFVQSPYFNKHHKVLELMDILYEAYPEFSEEKINRDTLTQQLFKEEKDSSTTVAHIVNYLQRLFEQFLAIEAYTEDEFLSMYLPLATIRKDIPKLYERQLIKLTDEVYNQGQLNATSYYHRSLIENELDYFSLNRRKKADTDHLQNKSDNLDLFYIVSKLECWCDMVNRSNVLNIDYEFPMLLKVTSQIRADRKKYLSFPLIKVYYQILLALQHPDEPTHYRLLKNYLQKHADEFAKEDAKKMYDYAQNYCIKQINQGESRFLKELLFFYRVMIDKELIYENGIFAASDYKNIVTIACRLEEFDWTENFIHQFKERLDESTREHVYQYNLASFYFEKGDYDQALRLLHAVEFTDVYFALGARSMLMKIYYETNETDPLFSHFDSFRTYLRRNKLVSKYQLKIHNNFIKYTKRAYNIKIKLDWERKQVIKAQTEKLLQRVTYEKEITNRNWLEKQVKALANA